MPKPEFLANMNISSLTVEQLRKYGWNIVRVSEVMDGKSKDIDILTFAQKQNKVVVTQDLDFFNNLGIKRICKTKSHKPTS